jgi:hypothetical protein
MAVNILYNNQLLFREKPMYLPYPRLQEPEKEEIIPPPEVVLRAL